MPLATKASNLVIKFSYFKADDVAMASEAMRYNGSVGRDALTAAWDQDTGSIF